MRDWKRYVDRRLPYAEHDGYSRDEVVEELASMLGCAESEQLECGATELEARAHAEEHIPDWEALHHELVDAGNARRLPARLKSALRASVVAGRRSMFVGIGQDLKRALRTVSQYPGFSLVAVVILALGIGANAALVTVVDTVLLRPLPYEEPERLVRVHSTHAEMSIAATGVSTGDVKDFRSRNEGLAGIGAWYTMGRTLRTDQESQVVIVAQVSEDFFSVMGTPPMLGRTFTPEETARAKFNTAASHVGTDPVVVLSHRVWEARFGGDPAVLERTIEIERQAWRVLGVMPADFAMPTPEVDFWIPWSFEGERPHDQRYLDAVARLESGVSLDEAEDELNAIAVELGRELPESNEGWGVRITPLQEFLVGDSRRSLVVLFLALALVLLIACVNIAGLQLVRIGEQSKEISLRAALGASVSRLIRHFAIQGSFVSLLGGLVSLPIAWVAVQALRILSPDAIPRLHEVGVDSRLWLACAVLTLAAGALFSLIPAFAVRARQTGASLYAATVRSSVSAPRWQRFRQALVVSELAMAVVLLVAAGLLLRSYVRLTSVDPGFRAAGVVVLPITLDNHEYDSGDKTRAYYRQLLESLSAVPGVSSVGGVTALPLSPIGPDFDRPIWAEGEAPSKGGARRADVRMATPGYFETLGISLVQGRGFNASDGPRSPKVVMVSEGLASSIWPGENPLTKRLVIDYASAGTYPYQVVGVVEDLRFRGLRATPRPELYLPHAQRSYLIMNIAVRTSRDPHSLAPELHRSVLSVDPLQPAHSARPLSDLVAFSVRRDRLAMLLMGGFATVALLLSMLGLFGTVSYYVAQRSHEFGIRTALGASRGSIIRMMLGIGLRMATFGVAIGIFLSLATGELLESILYEVSPTDITVLLSAAAALTICVLAACCLPALRAASVDPAVTLRHD